MGEPLAVGLVSVAISLATLIYTMVMARRKAGVDRVKQMEQDIHNIKLELITTSSRLADCEEDRFALRKEVLDIKNRTA